MITKQTERFLKRKHVRDILLSKVLTSCHYERLNDFFDHYGTPKKVENMLATIACFVLYDLNNYKGRYRRLKGISGTSIYTQVLRYGKANFKEIYKTQTTRKKAGFKNCSEYWINLGYTEEAAKQEVIKIQKARNMLSVEKTKGTSEYTCRSVAFWLKQGYTELEAKAEVSNIQTTNGLIYYTKKYGEDIGRVKYEARIKQWQQTLSNKSKEDNALFNLKKSHSIKGGMARGLSYEEALNKYNDYCEKMKSKPTQRFSKISQHLFDAITKYVQGNMYYETRNYEYLIDGLRVDFFHKDSGTVIEFHGDYFHRNPLMYEADMKSFGYTSKEKWDSDFIRENRIRDCELVKKLVIIWESEYRSTPDIIIKKCVTEIGE